MAIHPCCGSSLQRGVKILAIIGIVLGTIVLALFALALGAVSAKEEIEVSGKGVTTAMLVILIILSILGLCLSVLLLTAARKRDIGKCRFWLIVSSILIVMNLVTFIVHASAGDTAASDITSNILGIIYRLYSIWVVYAFMGELTSEGSSGIPAYPPNQV